MMRAARRVVAWYLTMLQAYVLGTSWDRLVTPGQTALVLGLFGLVWLVATLIVVAD